MRSSPYHPRTELPFFFFQAEDGIRDGHVTGVQTCALPILARFQLQGRERRSMQKRRQGVGDRASEHCGEDPHSSSLSSLRSEERRVGKECRCRRWRGRENKKRKKGVGEGEV